MQLTKISSVCREYIFRRHQDIERVEPLRLDLCLKDWVETFSPEFTAGNHRLGDRAFKYVCGLLQTDRANLERMSETVPDTGYQPIQHFISHSPWEDRPIRKLMAEKLNRLLGQTPYSGLLIDETPFAKKGTKSVGVSRQWNGQKGKVDNCQVAVFSTLCDSDHASLLDSRLFLRKEWCDDPKRCKAAGIPAEHMAHKSKTELALELIDEADDFGVDYAWVGVDAGYGKDPAFLRALVQRGKTFFADVHKTQQIYIANPTKKHPRPGCRGKQRKLTTTPKPMTVADWVEAQPKRKWKNVLLRYGSRGRQMARVLHGHIWVWDKKKIDPILGTWW